MINLWNQYDPPILLIAYSLTFYPFKYAEDHPNANVSDLLSLKDFMKDVVFGIKGAEDDPDPLGKTVIVYWKQFTAS